MKSKTLIILFILFCLFAGITFFTLNSKKDSALKNKKLLSQLSLGDIASITILSSTGSVNLKKAETLWIVENRFNYPANFSMIADFAKKLKEIKTGMSFTASKETITRLALHKPGSQQTPEDRQGVRVILKDGSENILTDIILGKIRNDSSRTSGQYVMPAKENTIYLIDKNFRFLEKKPSEWIRKKLMEINTDQIESISCYSLLNKKTLYTLKRPRKGKDPEFVNSPPGKNVVPSKIHEVFGALSSLTIEDITPAVEDISPESDKNEYRMEYHLFNGMIYTIYPGKTADKEEFFLKAQVNFTSPPPKTDDAESAVSEKADKQNLDAEAQQLNKKLSPWTYIISECPHKRFITDLKEFSEQ